MWSSPCICCIYSSLRCHHVNDAASISSRHQERNTVGMDALTTLAVRPISVSEMVKCGKTSLRTKYSRLLVNIPLTVCSHCGQLNVGLGVVEHHLSYSTIEASIHSKFQVMKMFRNQIFYIRECTAGKCKGRRRNMSCCFVKIEFNAFCISKEWVKNKQIMALAGLV